MNFGVTEVLVGHEFFKYTMEIQIKTTTRYHLISIRMAKLIEIVGKDIGKREPLPSVGENVNWCRH